MHWYRLIEESQVSRALVKVKVGDTDLQVFKQVLKVFTNPVEIVARLVAVLLRKQRYQ